MKSLALLRHAKTQFESPTGRDFDRELAERGEGDAARMGAEIRALSLQFDLVLCSTARRAVQTAQLAGLSPRFEESIYGASTGELLALVQQTAPDVESVLMVGHNPGFQHLASLFAGQSMDMPTGALAHFELPIDVWEDAGSGPGTLLRFLRPKDLR